MRKEYNIFHEVRAVNGVFYLWKCWGVSSLLALRAETYSFVRFLRLRAFENGHGSKLCKRKLWFTVAFKLAMIQQLSFTLKAFNFQQLITHNAEIRFLTAMFGHVMMCLFLKRAECARAPCYCQTWHSIVSIEKMCAKLVCVMFAPTGMSFANISCFVHCFHVFLSAPMRAISKNTVRCTWIALISVWYLFLKFRPFVWESYFAFMFARQTTFKVPTESIVVLFQLLLVSKYHPAVDAFEFEFVHDSWFFCYRGFVNHFFFLQSFDQPCKHLLRFRGHENNIFFLLNENTGISSYKNSWQSFPVHFTKRHYSRIPWYMKKSELRQQFCRYLVASVKHVEMKVILCLRRYWNIFQIELSVCFPVYHEIFNTHFVWCVSILL